MRILPHTPLPGTFRPRAYGVGSQPTFPASSA